jgi:hypothetical protein
VYRDVYRASSDLEGFLIAAPEPRVISELPSPARNERCGCVNPFNKAIERAHAIDDMADDGAALWRSDASILAWLEAL